MPGNVLQVGFAHVGTSGQDAHAVTRTGKNASSIQRTCIACHVGQSDQQDVQHCPLQGQVVGGTQDATCVEAFLELDQTE